MLPRDIPILDFLVTRPITKELIEAIVNKLPAREFYYPELSNDIFRDYRTDIHELIDGARQNPKYLPTDLANAATLMKTYDDEIKQLVTLKRKLLVFGILMQQEEECLEILANLMINNHLYRQLPALKEQFPAEGVISDDNDCP